jgi:site-specific recombinase XerD
MDKRGMLFPKWEVRMKTLVKNLEESKDICEENKKDLTEFTNSLEAKGISVIQRIAYYDRLMPLARHLGKPFRDANHKDVESYLAKYRSRGVTAQTINKFSGCVKCFYRWLYDRGSGDSAPEAVRWLKREPTPPKLRAENLITEEDIQKLIGATRTLRDRCIISVLYEAGMRPGELRALKMRDVKINGDMVRLYVAGKTERRTGERLVPIPPARTLRKKSSCFSLYSRSSLN